MRLLPLIVTALALLAVGTSTAASGPPAILFPVVGAVTFHDDFGDPRGGIRHQGNDLVADRRAPAVAVEDGRVEYWTTSRSAGCMLYLYGDSGTMYEYIHLNNDLTAANDNTGKCVQGVAYAVPDGLRVAAGQQIGYVGDSGDADGIHPHLHFEVHPKGGKATDPYALLRKAPHLLVTAPPAGSGFTLKLTGSVVAALGSRLTVSVDTLAAWPSHLKQKQLRRTLTLAVPQTATVDALPGERVVAWTLPAPGTVAALTGAPGALSLDRLAPR